jgi:hypothetical protein
MPLWNEVLAIFNEEPLFLENAIVEKIVVDENNYSFKIRSKIKDNLFFQIRYRQIDAQVRYSYQLFSSKPIGRWDNSPHFSGLENFPHHFHDESDSTKSSKLIGDIFLDLNVVLRAVRKYCDNNIKQ